MEVPMRRRINLVALSILLLTSLGLSQEKPARDKPQKPGEEQTIKISTELVQLDVVVTGKDGRAVGNLGKDDFELSENGKKQHIDLFQFVQAGKGRGVESTSQKLPSKEAGVEASTPGVSEMEVRRIFAFVIDDLTIRYEDLTNIREMLTNFVDNRMAVTDLVAIVRTVGGKGLLQQFTTDKDLLRRAIR